MFWFCWCQNGCFSFEISNCGEFWWFCIDILCFLICFYHKWIAKLRLYLMRMIWQVSVDFFDVKMIVFHLKFQTCGEFWWFFINILCFLIWFYHQLIPKLKLCRITLFWLVSFDCVGGKFTGFHLEFQHVENFANFSLLFHLFWFGFNLRWFLSSNYASIYLHLPHLTTPCLLNIWFFLLK